jgi:hypothetical protein
MEYPIKSNIPYEEIENGALVLLLLRESKTWEELCGRYAAGLNQALSVLRIDFGPGTVGTPGSESLKPGLFVVSLSLTVNPSIAKRLIEGLGIGEGFLAGSFLKKAEPNSIRLTVVASEPVPKCRCGWESSLSLES